MLLAGTRFLKELASVTYTKSKNSGRPSFYFNNRSNLSEVTYRHSEQTFKHSGEAFRHFE
ncbi:hypothetical protein [Chryseobacterium taeanense]|uniref:hypothetical protein n=1 Tax=Chryseobacterium taeanense TaxID=311334 RepID=UPI0035B1D463